jgi:arabinofuranosyltransferase
VRIGGDFMVGRHLALPLLAAVIALCRALPQSPFAIPIGLASALALALAAPHQTFEGDAWIQRGDAIPELHGVKDERSVYAPYSAAFSGFPLREHPWKQQGLRALAAGRQVVPRAAVGLFGFYAGPGVWVVDANALGDPLLARLPARSSGDSGWRIGHHARDLPEGYLESLRTGSNQIAHPGLARFYDSIALVTRGELWSSERLGEIASQLRGTHDGEIRAYVAFSRDPERLR